MMKSKKPVTMYLVAQLRTEINSTGGFIFFDKNGPVTGYMLVYGTKKEATKAAEKGTYGVIEMKVSMED